MKKHRPKRPARPASSTTGSRFAKKPAEESSSSEGTASTGSGTSSGESSPGASSQSSESSRQASSAAGTGSSASASGASGTGPASSGAASSGGSSGGSGGSGSSTERPSSAAGGKGGGRKKGAESDKSKSKTGLIIGILIPVLLGAGFLIYFLTGGSGGESDGYSSGGSGKKGVATVDSAEKDTTAMKKDSAQTASADSTKAKQDKKGPAGKKYHIVIGSFSKPSNAQGLKVKYENQGKDVKIIKPYGSYNYHRVAVAEYPSWDKAKKNLDKYRKQFGKETWILKR